MDDWLQEIAEKQRRVENSLKAGHNPSRLLLRWYLEDTEALRSRVEELEAENRRLRRQIGKMLAGDEVEIMDVQISWVE